MTSSLTHDSGDFFNVDDTVTISRWLQLGTQDLLFTIPLPMGRLRPLMACRRHFGETILFVCPLR